MEEPAAEPEAPAAEEEEEPPAEPEVEEAAAEEEEVMEGGRRLPPPLPPPPPSPAAGADLACCWRARRAAPPARPRCAAAMLRSPQRACPVRAVAAVLVQRTAVMGCRRRSLRRWAAAGWGGDEGIGRWRRGGVCGGGSGEWGQHRVLQPWVLGAGRPRLRLGFRDGLVVGGGGGAGGAVQPCPWQQSVTSSFPPGCHVQPEQPAEEEPAEDGDEPDVPADEGAYASQEPVT